MDFWGESAYGWEQTPTSGRAFLVPNELRIESWRNHIYIYIWKYGMYYNVMIHMIYNKHIYIYKTDYISMFYKKGIATLLYTHVWFTKYKHLYVYIYIIYNVYTRWCPSSRTLS